MVVLEPCRPCSFLRRRRYAVDFDGALRFRALDAELTRGGVDAGGRPAAADFRRKLRRNCLVRLRLGGPDPLGDLLIPLQGREIDTVRALVATRRRRGRRPVIVIIKVTRRRTSAMWRGRRPVIIERRRRWPEAMRRRGAVKVLIPRWRRPLIVKGLGSRAGGGQDDQGGAGQKCAHHIFIDPPREGHVAGTVTGRLGSKD